MDTLMGKAMKDEKGNLQFVKRVITDKYVILFNLLNGMEIISGINDNPDPFVLEYPSLLDIGIMGTCKNNCEFCYQGYNEYPHDMLLEHYKGIISESAPYVTQVALGGKGDPNLHENFREIIKYTLENSIIPNYTTSGNGLTDEQVEISKGCGAVAVSNYHKDFTFSALKKFMDAGIKTNIHFVVSDSTIQDAVDVMRGKDIWNGQVDFSRLNAIIFLLFKPQGKGKTSGLSVSEESIKRFRETMKDLSNIKFKIGMDSCMVCRIQDIDSLTTQEKLYLDSCEGSRMSAYVTPDARLVPCSFADFKVWSCNTDVNGIKGAWNSGLFENFRSRLRENPTKCPLGY